MRGLLFSVATPQTELCTHFCTLWVPETQIRVIRQEWVR
jgi:hypothetical protein